MTRANLLAATAVLLLYDATTAFAAEDGASTLSALAYVDDRTSPDSLLRSLYNAVNRHEFARAWSYFSTPPSRSFQAFVDGYADTKLVDVVTGRPVADGAAGSTFYLVPVAIRAIDTKDGERIFAGCYTLKQVNPQIQEPPFRPLTIEKGGLKPVDDAMWLSNALPEDCEGRKAEDESPAELADRVIALHRAIHRSDCNLIDDQRPLLERAQPEIHELRFRYGYESADDPEHKATLFRFSCATYAYNVSEAYYLANAYGEIEPVAFAEPELDITYETDANEKVKSMTIAGFNTALLLVNSEFDAENRTITSYSKWRGLGDAFSAGTWKFADGRFTLSNYAVDAAYDGEPEPVELLDYSGKR